LLAQASHGHPAFATIGMSAPLPAGYNAVASDDFSDIDRQLSRIERLANPTRVAGPLNDLFR